MPIAFPDEPKAQPAPAEQAPTRPGERDRTRTHANTRPDQAASSPQDQAPAVVPDGPGPVPHGGEVVPFPGSERLERAPEPGALVLAAKSWWAEASQTAARAVDGSVLRARPPAIRDSWVRMQRAEWSGGIPALAWLGWIYGYPIQIIRAGLMGLLWLLDHPSRLLIAGGVVIVALYLH